MKAIINGDNNIKFNTTDPLSLKFNDLISTFNFRYILKSKTRKNNYINNIISNLEKGTYTSGVTEPGLSNHAAVTMSIQVPNLSINATKLIKYRKFTDRAMFYFYRKMETVDWSFIQDPNIDLDTKYLLLEK